MGASNLTDLLARLEAAEGADRELGFQVICAALGGEYLGLCNSETLSLGYKMRLPNRVVCSSLVAGDEADVTASLDASLGLVERVLPGWKWGLDTFGSGESQLPFAMLWLSDERHEWARAPTPALAMLCAMVKALVAQHAAG